MLGGEFFTNLAFFSKGGAISKIYQYNIMSLVGWAARPYRLTNGLCARATALLLQTLSLGWIIFSVRPNLKTMKSHMSFVDLIVNVYLHNHGQQAHQTS
jgi:hypothetical protein